MELVGFATLEVAVFVTVETEWAASQASSPLAITVVCPTRQIATAMDIFEGKKSRIAVLKENPNLREE